MAAHRFRLTKYDPALRDERGAFTGDDWTSISDIGRTFDGQRLTLAEYLAVEARHLIALGSFVEEAGVEGFEACGVEAFERPALAEGQRLSSIEAIEAARAMLRNEFWCRLEAADGFYIHVGNDFYVYVGSPVSSAESVRLAERLGLFVDRDFPSPYEPQD